MRNASIASLATAVCHACQALALADESGLSQIAEAWTNATKNVQTILIEHDVQVEFLVDPAVVLGEFGALPPVASVSVLNVLHKDGRCYFEVRDDWGPLTDPFENALQDMFPEYASGEMTMAELPYERVLEVATDELQKLTPNEKTAVRTIFDGATVWQKTDEVFSSPSRAFTAWTVLDTTRTGRPVLPKSLLQRIGLSFRVKELPFDDADRASEMLPSAFDNDEFQVVTGNHMVNGVSCILAESPKQQLFMDPLRNYAIVRRVWKWTDGLPVYTLNSSEFAEIVAGLWLPKRIETIQYGAAGVGSGMWSGKAVYKRVHSCSRIEINEQQHSSYLAANVRPGEVIVDQSLAALDANGNAIAAKPPVDGAIPTVSYTMPADKSTLDAVIASARQEAGRRADLVQGRRSLHWGIALFSLCLVLAVLLLWIRRIKHTSQD